VSWRASTGFLVRYESADGVVDIPYDAQDAGQVALAYCATVHKSQGCEFPAVVLVVGWDSYMLLRRPMVYTALTRARERLVVLAEEGALERAAATEDDSVRHQDLEGAASRAAPD
jgi:exodeoxyribonuclease V alpha subunit